MRKYTFVKSVFCFLFLILLMEGCQPEKKNTSSKDGNIERYSMIISPSQGRTFKSGEDIKIEVSLTDIPGDFEKIEIRIDNKIIFTSSEGKSSYVVNENSVHLSMGAHTITSQLFLKDTDGEVNSISFTVISDVNPKRFSYLVRNTLRHDNTAYTQGFEFKDGLLYEGTGLNGKSELRLLDWRTGNVIKNVKLDDQYFGEGITIIDDKIYQITYQSHKGFVYDLKSFEKLKEFTYTTEGWGLTHIEDKLVMSDGTNKLYFINKETFEREKEIEVYDNVGPVYMINELEYINGEIWANIYLTNEIIIINPESGKVTAKIDFNGIFNPASVSYKTDVMNGIAYQKETNKIFITGKLWPNVFEIELLNED